MSRSQGVWVILVVLLLGLVAAFAAIMEMRFSPGDIYPHYSTRRSDPLGGRAFYESLQKLPGMEVSRNLASLHRIKALDEDTTLVLLGLPRSSLTKLRVADDSPVLEAVRNGTRLVIVMNPGFVPISIEEDEDEADWFKRRAEIKKKHEGEGDGSDSDEDESAEDEEMDRGESFLDHVNVAMMVPKEFKRPDEGWTLERAASEADGLEELPEAFPRWYSQFRFTELEEPWKGVALVEGLPVVVMREYGKGEIVITSDSYFSSNEALWKREDTSFLWWLLGGKKRVVFDETIHGSKESGGIMKLIRRFRLHGFFAGLFIFLVLLAWSSGSSLVPGSEEMDLGLVASEGTVAGEDASSGMVRLLRRSIRPTELLDQCADVWKKGDGGIGAGNSALTPSQQNEMDRLLQIRRENPKDLSLCDAYEKLIQILRKK